MFYFGREGRNLCFLGTPNFTHFLASSSYAVSANLRQDVEPVEVNGPLSTVCWGSGVSIFSTGKPDGQGQTLVSSWVLQAHSAFLLGKEAERAGMWAYPRSLTALSTSPLKVAPFCYAEWGAKR